MVGVALSLLAEGTRFDNEFLPDRNDLGHVRLLYIAPALN